MKACPQNAIDVRGYAEFAPMGHSVRCLREEEKGTISWKVTFRDGREKNFVSPIRTTPWGSIKSPSDYEAPSPDALGSQELAHEPDALNIDALPALTPDQLKQGVVSWVCFQKEKRFSLSQTFSLSAVAWPVAERPMNPGIGGVI